MTVGAVAATMAATGLLCASSTPVEGQGRGPEGDVQQVRQRLIDRAVAYLQLRGRRPDGSYAPNLGIGPTALVVTGLLSTDRFGPDHPFVAESLKYLHGFVQADGGIYRGDVLRNYTTSVALMAFHGANKDARYDSLIAKAQKFLTGLQWDEGEGKKQASAWYGGVGYGRHKRPDLSNLQLMLEALKQSGLSKDDPAWRRAVVFLTRCQNLGGEFNDQPWAELVNDGGFIYTPANGGESKAGATPAGGLRSYGSMTYAGLKSMLYAGLSKDDPRVKAARGWIRKHYTLDENPGLGSQGLYYYYHTFAKTLHVLGEDTLVDAQGRKHDWRQELVRKLAQKQRRDGSWTNPEDRWFEGEPALVTGYVLMALAYCR
jgi:squalene-hopene/tetraprenyl-beta-curcumene cyclase